MGLKHYIIGVLIFILAVLGFVFSLESGDYRLEFYDHVILLPIAIWVLAPTILLFIMSIIHILYYSFTSYIYKRNTSKDKEILINLIQTRLKNSTSTKLFKSKIFKEIGIILNKLNISVKNQNFNSKDKNMDSLVEKIYLINNGEYVDIKSLNLSKDNSLLEMNNINRTLIDENYCLSVLKKSLSYSDNLVKAAFEQIIKVKKFSEINKIIESIELTKGMILALLSVKNIDGDKITLTVSELIEKIYKVDLNKTEYLIIAKNCNNIMEPDFAIKLFETISSKKEEATGAYLYLLFQYEMIDDARELLSNSQKNDYLPYKALLDLRDNGKDYTIDNISYLR